MNNDNRLTNYKISYSTILILSLFVLFLLLIPIFYIAKYNVPSADDFSFSCETHDAVTNGDTLIGIIAAAILKVKDVYVSWQGSFSAVFLMTFQPSIWGFCYYSMTTFIMLISLLSGIFLLSIRVFSGIFHVRKALAGIIAAVCSVACIQFVPVANQSFFWYNGSVYYTFTFGIFLLLYAIIIGFIQYGGYWRLLLISFLSVFIGGNNYVTALLFFIITFCIILFLLIKRNNGWLFLLLPFLLFIISFLINATAPGNAIRQKEALTHPGIIQSILLSFKYAAINSIKWVDFRSIACILFLLPFIWQATKVCSYGFPFPVLVSLFSICVYSSSFTPHIYALASDGPDRLKNIIYFIFILLIIFNLFWWCGWLSHRKGKYTSSNHTDSISFLPLILFSSMAFLSLICGVFVFHNSLTSVLAINELNSGEAKAYYEEALQRQIVLEDSTIKDCEFKPYQNMPYLLFFTDMTDDPSDFQNEDTSTYYQKNTILVK